MSVLTEMTHEDGTDLVIENKSGTKEPSPAQMLQKQELTISKLRATMTDAMFKMAAALAEAKTYLPKAGQVKDFGVYTCGLESSEVTTLLALHSKLGAHRDVCKAAGLNLAGAKALMRAGDDVREQILTTLKLGTRLKASEISSLIRQAKQAAEPATVHLERERKAAFGAAARQRSIKSLETLTAKAAELFVSMTPVFANDADEVMGTDNRQKIVTLAAECLALFTTAVDIDTLPEAWERQGSQTNEARLGRAHDALLALSQGDFMQVDDEGRPYDDEYEIDLVLYQAIAWLSGHADPSSVELTSTKSKANAATLRVEPERDLVVLEICAGGGGQKLGLTAAGFKTIAAFEFEVDAVKTLINNSNNLVQRIHHADIRSVDFTQYRDKVDLLAGGVPCQPFSTAGHRKGEADDRDLFRETIRIISEVQPRAFFFENVRGFANRNAGTYRRELRKAYAELGYDSQVFHFYGGDYGLGQARPRVAVIGFRDGLMSRFRMPSVTPKRSIGLVDAIGDLVRANGWQGYDAWAKTANRICPTLVGGSRRSNKLSYSSNFTTETWAGLGIDASSLATEAPHRKHEGLFQLTLQMGARLQGFPDDYTFSGVEMDKKRQIANALPPVMARMVGLAIHSVLTGAQYDYDAVLELPIATPQRKSYVGAKLNDPHEHDERAAERFFFKESPYFSADEADLHDMEMEHPFVELGSSPPERGLQMKDRHRWQAKSYKDQSLT